MALHPTASTTVFVAKPFEMSYADAMRGLRTWLDHKKIQPAGFKVANDAKIGFQITFSTEQDAVRNIGSGGMSPASLYLGRVGPQRVC